MCELLIRTEDRGCGQSFAGDVIHVAPDGWAWGRMELQPPFRVISLPGVNPNAFIDMVEPLRSGSGIICKRESYFDLNEIGNATLDELLRAKRKRRSAGVIG
jgi:hypothetical protein